MAEAWDAIAPGYASRAAVFTGSFGAELLAAACLGAGCTVLDVAAGSGTVALQAAITPGVAAVHACDLSPGMIEELTASALQLPAAAAEIECTVCDATALPMADDGFYAVVSNFGVIFAPDVAAGLAEMARVCRPGGRVAFTTWGRTPAFTAIEDAWRATLQDTAPAAPAPPDASAVVVARITQQLLDVGGLTDISVIAVEHELVVAHVCGNDEF